MLGAGRDPGRPLLIGSAKTNIGHLEAAAGIAGVIKVILSLEHETLPKHLHFENPSPHIPWDRLAVEVVKETMPWERNDRPRIAGVSSFGFAGTNAHVILEEAPVAPARGGDRPRSSSPGTEVQRPSALGPYTRRTDAGRRSIPQLVDRPPGGHPGGRVLHRREWGERTSSIVPRWWSIRPNLPSSCSARSRTTARHLVWCAENPRSQAEDGVAVHRSGQPVPRHGAGTVRYRAGIRRDPEPVRGGGRRCTRKALAGRDFRQRRRGQH